jgi:histone acetyltransferase (RNA polymerase elongator complex component)
MAPLYRCMEETQRSSSIRYANVLLYSSHFTSLSCTTLQGFGTLLMEEAERIAREEHGSVKLAVISGKSGHTRKQDFIAHFFAPSVKVWVREIIIED